MPLKQAAVQQHLQQAPLKMRQQLRAGCWSNAAGSCCQQIVGDRTEERVPFKGIRKVIANAMVKSVYTAPHVTLMDEVDVTALVALRTKDETGSREKRRKLTYLPFIVKALVAACRQFPVMNARLMKRIKKLSTRNTTTSVSLQIQKRLDRSCHSRCGS